LASLPSRSSSRSSWTARRSRSTTSYTVVRSIQPGRSEGRL
jgi:hypothetical protein